MKSELHVLDCAEGKAVGNAVDKNDEEKGDKEQGSNIIIQNEFVTGEEKQDWRFGWCRWGTRHSDEYLMEQSI